METLKTALGGLSKFSFLVWKPELLGKILIA
jgi:hypothetical protein